MRSTHRLNLIAGLAITAASVLPAALSPGPPGPTRAAVGASAPVAVNPAPFNQSLQGFGMPPENVVKWLAVVGDAAKVLAILAGGLWSIFLFASLRQWSRGRIELEKVAAEVKKLEFENFRQAVLQLSMKTRQKTIKGDKGRYVLGIVDIENKGNRNTRVSWGKEKPLSVRTVEINGSGVADYGTPMQYAVSAGREDVEYSGWIVRVGAREQIPFCIRIDAPGLYQIVFRARLSVEEKEVSSQLGVTTDDWWVMSYTIVT